MMLMLITPQKPTKGVMFCHCNILIFFARQSGLFDIEVQPEYAKAIYLIVEGCDVDHPCHHVVQAIKEWNVLPMVVSFIHVLRECKGVADAFAKLGLSMQRKVVYYFDPPLAILSFEN